MLNNGKANIDGAIGGEIPENQQRSLVRHWAALTAEISKLIDENAYLAADNKRLKGELDALNNALEDDGK